MKFLEYSTNEIAVHKHKATHCILKYKQVS